MPKRKPVMPEITTMNAQELAAIRQLIAARLAELDGEDVLGHGGQDVVTLDQQSVGRLSRMDALQNQAMAKAQQSRRDMERHRLGEALRRMGQGEYGFCADCGEDIPYKRLALDPAASRCVTCASG